MTQYQPVFKVENRQWNCFSPGVLVKGEKWGGGTLRWVMRSLHEDHGYKNGPLITSRSFEEKAPSCSESSYTFHHTHNLKSDAQELTSEDSCQQTTSQTFCVTGVRDQERHQMRVGRMGNCNHCCQVEQNLDQLGSKPLQKKCTLFFVL